MVESVSLAYMFHSLIKHVRFINVEDRYGKMVHCLVSNAPRQGFAVGSG